MTHGCDEATRSVLAWRIAVHSFALVLGSLLFGSLVLRLFELSVPVIQVAGGAVALSILLTYRYAGRFANRIGHEGMIVVLRLSAFIVLSIGVQIAWNGVKALLKEIGIPT
jgi:multiple antibiotic resistance protein